MFVWVCSNYSQLADLWPSWAFSLWAHIKLLRGFKLRHPFFPAPPMWWCHRWMEQLLSSGEPDGGSDLQTEQLKHGRLFIVLQQLFVLAERPHAHRWDTWSVGMKQYRVDGGCHLFWPDCFSPNRLTKLCCPDQLTVSQAALCVCVCARACECVCVSECACVCECVKLSYKLWVGWCEGQMIFIRH